ncbi:F-box domain [Macleaya cordata]|uniref:F-box domain n=1 Tax=Macleaya cordata TaxID=56857 RepID=A0A200QFH2_MACCD|nr:F-box domain [Macleaya cordata]
MDLGENRISELPDSLLHHILCFLPTKCAIRTSILSRRWRYLYTSIPILDFRKWRSHTSTSTLEGYRLEHERFRNFLDRILNLHDMPNLLKFYLHCDRHFNESRVNAWISSVIRRKVEELDLSLFGEYNLFPPSLFTCESLTILELKMDVEYVLHLPQSISFPRLKILRLTDITFMDENLTQQLFSNCPVLEELSISSCLWINMKVLCILAPALKCLFFNSPSEDGSDTLDNCEVKIYAPSLLSLRYYEGVATNYFLHSFSSLVNADIDLMFLDDSLLTRVKIGYSASKLLGGLSNVKHLTLSGDTFKALSFAYDTLINLPTFYNLVHLEVGSMFPCSTNRTLLEFLHIVPNLESLLFTDGFNQGIYDGDDGWAINLMAPCLLLHLKSVEIRQFSGHSRELSVICRTKLLSSVLEF